MATVRIQVRRGTSTDWSTVNPTLAAGEMGVETDTRKIKVGDGSTAWNSLAYIAANVPEIGEIAQDAINSALTMGTGLTKNYDDGGNTITLEIDTNVIATQGYVDAAVAALGGSVDSTYIPMSDRGAAGGVASLDSNTLIPNAQIDSAHWATKTYADGLQSQDLYALSAHNETHTNVHGIADTAALATKVYADDHIAQHASNTLDVHGIADTGALALKSEVLTAKEDAIAAAGTLDGIINNTISTLDTTLHGLINDLDTELSGTISNLDIALNSAITDEATARNTAVSGVQSNLNTHTSATTSVHGIADTAALATKSYADNAATTAENAAKAYADALTTSDIAEGSNLYYTDERAQDAVGNSLGSGLSYNDSTGAVSVDTSIIQARVSGISDTEIGYLDGVTSSIQTQLNSKAPTSSPTFTGTVSGITKSMVGLGNVDNTSDADKPVSTATQTALDLKAPKAAPTFTGTTTTADLTVTGNLTVNGTTTTVSSTNLEVTDPLIYIGTGNSANSKDLGVVGHFDNGTYQHSGIVRDATDGKWKLFSGVTTEPTDVIDFTTWTKDTLVLGTLEANSATIGNVSNTELQYLDGVTSSIQTQIDAKAPSSSPTLTTPTISGALTLSSSGVVFTDGTQTKQGVPSQTAISSKTADYTVSLSDRDTMIEVNSSSNLTISIPTDATTNFPIGTSIDILRVGTGTVTVSAVTPGTTTLNYTPGNKLRAQWSSASLFKRAANTWVLIGDLTA